ncbi:MAG: threonine/serine dehydratase [Anaerolineae bacterium]|nr:threonine/serine dehydratase [Anaerolineae bacterium]
MPSISLSLPDIYVAQARLRPYLPPTPLLEATSLTAQVGHSVWAKLETVQPTGSFKVRGALNALLTLDPALLPQGVVTASAGNHGLGLAYAARQVGTMAHIFLGTQASPAKIARIHRLGATVHLVPGTYAEAHHAAEEFTQQTGLPYIHAYAGSIVMAGQGTLALELLAQRPDLSAVIVPVGGGGLIAGMAVVLKTLRPDIQLIAVQPEASPSLSRSLADGTVYEEYPAGETIADGVAGGVGHAVVAVARAGWIDQVVDLPEASLHRALAWTVRQEGWLIEGSAALPIAALLDGAVRVEGPVAVVLTGGNIAAAVVMEILGE